MTRYVMIILLAIVILAMYGLNRGIYVGSQRYVSGAPCCPGDDEIQKRCRYLFVTGISEIDARDGSVAAPNAHNDPVALAAAL